MRIAEHNRRARLWNRLFDIVDSEKEYWEGENDNLVDSEKEYWEGENDNLFERDHPSAQFRRRRAKIGGALQALENVLTQLRDEVTK